MFKVVSNNNYKIILYVKDENLTYILNETIEDLKSDNVINWPSFKVNDSFFNNNGDKLEVAHIDSNEKIIILEIY